MISACLEEVLELADAALHVALLVLGRVVVAVLAQVAEQSGRFDLVGHLDAPTRGEVVELGLQSFVRRSRELGSCHRTTAYRERSREGGLPDRCQRRCTRAVGARGDSDRSLELSRERALVVVAAFRAIVANGSSVSSSRRTASSSRARSSRSLGDSPNVRRRARSSCVVDMSAAAASSATRTGSANRRRARSTAACRRGDDRRVGRPCAVVGCVQIGRHGNDADHRAVLVVQGGSWWSRTSLATVGTQDQLEFVADRLAGGQHACVLGLVRRGEVVREQFARTAAEHRSRVAAPARSANAWFTARYRPSRSFTQNMVCGTPTNTSCRGRDHRVHRIQCGRVWAAPRCTDATPGRAARHLASRAFTGGVMTDPSPAHSRPLMSSTWQPRCCVSRTPTRPQPSGVSSVVSARSSTTRSPRELTFAMTDEVLRFDETGVLRSRLRAIVDDIGVPPSLGMLDRWALRLGATVAGVVPRLVMPLVHRRIVRESSGVVLSADDPAFAQHLARRAARGLRLNVNVLGEAILRDAEADRAAGHGARAHRATRRRRTCR